MAIATFNVAAAGVKGKIPFDTSDIGVGTEPVSDSDINTAIDEKASQMAGVLERASVDASDLSDEAEAQIQEAIRAGAAAEVMQQVGHTGSAYEERRDQFEELRGRYANQTNLDRSNGTVAKLEESQARDADRSDWTNANFSM